MRALIAWRGGLFLTERGVVCVFSILTRVGVYVSVCVCIRTHTHTLHRWGTWMWTQGSEETPGAPEEFRWTKFRHMCIRICVQSRHALAAAGVTHPCGTPDGYFARARVLPGQRGAAIVHMYIYMLRGGRRFWTNCFFVLYIFSKKSKRCKCKTIPQI